MMVSCSSDFAQGCFIPLCQLDQFRSVLLASGVATLQLGMTSQSAAMPNASFNTMKT